ncbi:hypothetical protein NUU61_006550 [Penicillium alfredii]|uniref:Uncharacterized protein n=1 Tax=Penicillium alfredii TaxID=1506179 RepID=A0A9W9K3Q9_9EURO|nr:hypothetical protein NUU61_006550 [Penicillium alfredii]
MIRRSSLIPTFFS